MMVFSWFKYYLLYNLKRGYCVVGDIVILIFI